MKLSKEQEEHALAMHKKSIVIDGHSDYSVDIARYQSQGESRVYESRHLPDLKKGGVTAEVMTVGGDLSCGPIWGASPYNVLEMLNYVLTDFTESKNSVVIVNKADDIRRAKKNGKTALIFCLEGSKPLENKLYLLRIYHSLGIRYLGLTWNGRNLVADGCGEKEPAGLSNFGRSVVEEANRLGIVIDVSHASEPSFWDTLEMSNAPIVASHSNARVLCNHPRNLNDDQIKALAEKEGVIGMNCWPRFIDEKYPSLSKLLNHLDYVEKLVGTDHISLGPDFAHYLIDVVKSDLNQMSQEGIPMSLKDLTFPENISRASDLVNITKGLVYRGYSDHEIRRILGGNLMRIYSKVFG